MINLRQTNSINFQNEKESTSGAKQEPLNYKTVKVSILPKTEFEKESKNEIRLSRTIFLSDKKEEFMEIVQIYHFNIKTKEIIFSP